MENTKAKNVIITVLGILLVAVICFIVYYIFIVNNNNESNEQQAVTITKLQEEVAEKEREITELKKSQEDLKKQVEELSSQKNVKVITINSKIIDKLNEKLNNYKDEIVSRKDNYDEAEYTLKNGYVLSVQRDYSDEKLELNKTIIGIACPYKDLFVNYNSECTSDEWIKNFFGKNNITIDKDGNKFHYTIRYGDVVKNKGIRTIYFITDNNGKITDKTTCNIFWYHV